MLVKTNRCSHNFGEGTYGDYVNSNKKRTKKTKKTKKTGRPVKKANIHSRREKKKE